MALNIPHYHIKTSPDYLTFEFVSEGPRGKINKVVRYTEINIKGYFNLGFGDKDPETGFISDIAVTNNADSQTVLATVGLTLNLFLQINPDAVVIATGSTEARTRLYRIGIANNIETIKNQYTVFGLTENGWEPFRKDIKYGAFLVKKKA
jgi:hypothetical protein